MLASLSRRPDAFALMGLRLVPLKALIGLRPSPPEVFNRLLEVDVSPKTADFGREVDISTLIAP